MKKLQYFSFVILLINMIACTSDLDTKPQVELSLEELLAQDPNAVQGILSRLYASFALSGPSGPESKDIEEDDAGESPFLRGILNLQEFTADGMKNRWGDDGLDQLTTTSNWDENNKFFRYLYNRIYFTIPQCNNLLSALKIVNVADKENIRSEVRFLRALAYYYQIDCFGKGVLVTENESGTSTLLPEKSRAELFNFVESELLDIENKINPSNGYARANRHVVRTLLTKLYLNAKVYTGTSKYDKALDYASKVINEGGYSLESNFVKNFSDDNNTSKEIIYPIIADPLISQSFGNTTYIVNGSQGGTIPSTDFGAAERWFGHRATKSWYGLFANSISGLQTSNDVRARLFWTDGQTYEMTDYKEYANGLPSIKFRNSNSTGASTATKFSGTDFPLFRLADVYLMYAEAHLRGGGGSAPQALQYLNNVRSRSNASNYSLTDLTLDNVLDERGRELMLEGHRRQDLIRYEKFTGSSYLWPWKGNNVNGASIPNNYNLFPIPQKALQANSNLTQNPGY